MSLANCITLTALTATLALGPSCGSGTAALTSGGGGSGGGNANGPAVISGFTLGNSKVSPTTVRFVLSDAEADTSTVELRYQLVGEPSKRLSQISGVSTNPAALATSSQGVEYEVQWDFAAEDDFPDDASYVSGVHVFGTVAGGIQEIQIGANAAATGLGNDPPVVLDVIVPSVEVDGIVGVEFELSDSSEDVVDVRVEYDVIGDSPDTGWRLARPALLESTPDFAFEGVLARSTGSSFEFFWDTDVDLAELERDVRLRVTAVDPEIESAPFTTVAMHVDNNAVPIVQLQNDLVVTNPDERRGIPIPFRVIDEEEDLVEVIFQWRREGETFPSLPSDMTALDEVLADPEQRRAHRICTPYPRYAQGRVIPLDADTVRLPELAAGENWILASGLKGKSLELLRPSSVLEPITPRWSTNPLVSPIAALALGDGLTALVLDAPGSARLREIELATGAIVREIATLGPGIPSAMDFERGNEDAVVVALDSAGVWRIVRIELASGAVTELISSDGAESARVRGVASLGTHAAVFTAGSSLFFCDWQDPLAPQLGRLSTGLAAPWGVVVDPLTPGRLYVSERDANRVLAVDLNSHGRLPVVVHSAPLQLGTFDSPEALSIEKHGSRLLVVTGASGGLRQMEVLNLGAADGNVSFAIGAPVTGDITGMASGRDGLRLACVPAANELLAGGGVEQRRTILAYESFDAELDAALRPTARPGQSWRVTPASARIRGSAGGRAASFVWSSGVDAPSGARVFVRAVSRDDELGPAAEGAAPKALRAELDVEPLVLGGPTITSSPRCVAAADLDRDGDIDIVSANESSGNLTVFFQSSPGSFATQPLVLGGASITNFARCVAAADLDRDGDIDIVSANGNNLTIFFQTSPGSFPTQPLVLGGPSVTAGTRFVAAADLNGDGDLDIVSANAGSGNLTVFFQTSSGSFNTEPLVLGGFSRSIAVADIDGDGDIDIVSGNRVFLQGLPGSFAGPLILVGGGSSVATGDLDGDGDSDIVSADLDSSTLSVFFQTSRGSFDTQPLVLGGPSITNFPQSVTVTDIDGNGDLDIVSVNSGSENLTVFFQTSPGSFALQPLELGEPSIMSAPGSAATADLDGDGDSDIVSANPSSHNLTVFFQSSPGSFATSPLALSAPSITDGPRSVAAADLDSDGDLDLVSANSNSDNLTVFFQSSPGSFVASPLVLSAPSILHAPVSVAAADFDGDGELDLVSANSDSDNLTVFFQSSPGSFVASPLVLGTASITDGPRSVATADLDSDGDLDLVSANQFSGSLTVFLQDSPGRFATQPLVLSDGGSPLSVAVGDLDGDDDIDIVCVIQSGSSRLRVFLQGSPGNFAPSTLLALPSPVTFTFELSVATVDIDGDGDLDLVSANQDSLTVTVFFQTSPGSFDTQPLILGGGSGSVSAADFDNDGDIDLVSSRVFLQTSPRSFAPRPPVPGEGAVTAVDLDGDGDSDIVSASGNLTIFFGGR